MYEADKDIQDFRARNSINPDRMLRLSKNIDKVFIKAAKRYNDIIAAIKDKELIKLQQAREAYLGRVTLDVCKEILHKFKKPLSWAKPLQQVYSNQ